METVLIRAFSVRKKGAIFVSHARTRWGTQSGFLILAREELGRSLRQVSFGFSVSTDERWVLYSQFDQQGSDLMLVKISGDQRR
jgi:hypothetical protein